jgi:hypothetical protein
MNPAKIFSFAVFLVLLLVLSDLPASGAARQTVLLAIHWVENPNNVTHPGPRGELGPYQFLRETWAMHTNKPFSWANRKNVADEVAALHFEWIRRELERHGVEVTPYNVALVWNAGLGATVRGELSPANHDYAQRVANLCWDLARR